MPVMDGYALAAAIRAEEAAHPGARPRTPILALTANALHEDELRCRAVGMDAYLTKPVRLAPLRSAIEYWLGPAAGRAAAAEFPAAPVSDAAAAASAPVDLRVLRELVGEEPQVIAGVLTAFRTSAALSASAMAQSAGEGGGGARAVADAAHTLKSGARSIGAHALGQTCADIEQATGTGGGDLPLLLARLQQELAAVNLFLDSH
jgi:CheY-like chemotaxis protein